MKTITFLGCFGLCKRLQKKIFTASKSLYREFSTVFRFDKFFEFRYRRTNPERWAGGSVRKKVAEPQRFPRRGKVDSKKQPYVKRRCLLRTLARKLKQAVESRGTLIQEGV